MYTIDMDWIRLDQNWLPTAIVLTDNSNISQMINAGSQRPAMKLCLITDQFQLTFIQTGLWTHATGLREGDPFAASAKTRHIVNVQASSETKLTTNNPTNKLF